MSVHGGADDADVVAREIDVDVDNARGGIGMCNNCCRVGDRCVKDGDNTSKAEGDGVVHGKAEEEMRCRSRY